MSKFPCFLVAALFCALPADKSVAAGAGGLAFDPARLTRLDTTIQREIDEGKLAGAVMMIRRDGEVAHLRTFGQQSIEEARPMREDTIFRIASMSKAVTTVAVMMLYEEGRFMLRDPLAKYLPAFANSVVAVPPAADAPAGAKYSTVPAKRPIEIHDLLTHTAGLTYGEGLAVEDYRKARLSGWNFTRLDETIGEAIDRLATLPLHGQPGETWQYGYSTDVLGRLVEVVSGLPLDRFFEERIFKPLKMVDTCFYLPPEKIGRLASVYGIEQGKLVLKEDPAHSPYVAGPRKCFSGGAGLLSTAGDYGRFLQMLVNGGELDGVRLLSPLTVELMHRNHTGEKYNRETHGFGLGFWVNDDPGAGAELIGADSYGWGSAYFPQYIIDPKERMVVMFMTQLMPNGGSRLNGRMKVLTYQALVPKVP